MAGGRRPRPSLMQGQDCCGSTRDQPNKQTILERQSCNQSGTVVIRDVNRVTVIQCGECGVPESFFVAGQLYLGLVQSGEVQPEMHSKKPSNLPERIE